MAGLCSGEHVPIGVSVGVAVFQGDAAEPLPALIDRADQALHASKRGGKGIATLAASAQMHAYSTQPLNHPAAR